MHLSPRSLDRLVSGDLPPARAARLRAHLRGCARCRSAYDGIVVLQRALAGRPDRPTRAEEERMVSRALLGAGLRAPRPRPAPAPLFRFGFGFGPLAAGLAAAALLVAAAVGLRAAHRLAAGRAALAAATLETSGARINGAPARAGSAIGPGSTVEVDRSVAKLAVARGGELRLFPGTELRLGKRGERIELRRGEVWCLLDHNGKPFTVATDVGEVRDIGTSFVVERDEGGTDVRVLEGEVEVEDAHRLGTVHVTGGHRTRLRSDAPPAPPRVYVARRDRLAWDDFFARLVRDVQDLFDR